jgi:ABC-type multidrug transport system fused ATPase/permease subunit
MELQDLRKLIKNIRDKVKSYIHEGKSALSSVETSFQITAYPLGVGVTFSIPIREDKKQNIQDLAKEIKNLKENEIRELINNTKKILDILTDPKLVTKDDIEWVKKVIEEIRYIQENILNEIKISIDDAIKRAEDNLSKIISYSGSGLTLLTDSELTDDLAEREFKDWYEKGYPFGFAAIYHDKDYRRSIVDDVKRKLEENGKAVIVGESGTSKSTIWMRVICEYYKEGYIVLYNISVL